MLKYHLSNFQFKIKGPFYRWLYRCSQSRQSSYKNYFLLVFSYSVKSIRYLLIVSDKYWLSLCLCNHYCILINSINASLFPVLIEMPASTYEGLILLLIVLSVFAQNVNKLSYCWPLFCWTLHAEKIMSQ